jgi:hypothetical protein
MMTEGDARLVGSENEGAVAVGGNSSFSNYQVATNNAGSFVVPGDTNPTALVVGGRVDLAGSARHRFTPQPPLPSPSTAPLPVTGSVSLPLVGTGAVVLGVGLALLLLATDRRRARR